MNKTKYITLSVMVFSFSLKIVSSCIPTGHFRIALSLLFKPRPSAKQILVLFKLESFILTVLFVVYFSLGIVTKKNSSQPPAMNLEKDKVEKTVLRVLFINTVIVV